MGGKFGELHDNSLRSSHSRRALPFCPCGKDKQLNGNYGYLASGDVLCTRILEAKRNNIYDSNLHFATARIVGAGYPVIGCCDNAGGHRLCHDVDYVRLPVLGVGNEAAILEGC
jgi:hypothetical protein